MQDKTVICSVLSDTFVPGFVVMERTLRAQNPGWDMPVVAIQSPEAPLTDFSKAVIRAHCDNVHFAVANANRLAPTLKFASEVIGTPPRLWPAFSILEAISWSGFDRVIALDSDMVILGSLDALLHTQAPFSAVRAREPWTNAPARFFNTGVMVFNRALLLGFEVEKIPEYIGNRKPRRGTGLADQAVLNLLIHNAFVGWLPERFNLTKRGVAARLGVPMNDPDAVRDWLVQEDARVLHYVGEKPWDQKVRQSETVYQGVEAIWHEAAQRYGQKSFFQHMQQCDRAWATRYNAAFQEVSRAHRRLSGEALEKRVARAMGM